MLIDSINATPEFKFNMQHLLLLCSKPAIIDLIVYNFNGHQKFENL